MDVDYESPIKRNQRTSIFPPTPGPSLFARPKVPKDHSRELLEQPWLVQTDVLSSTSYLLKFYVSFEDMSCSLLMTDGQSVWSESLSGNQLTSRARACNSTGFAIGSSQSQLDQSHLENPYVNEDEGRLWLLKVLKKLAALYASQSAFEEIEFSVNDSFNADWEVETSSSDISWRWDIIAQQPKQSVDIISKYLILPLISLTGLAFSGPTPLSTLLDNEPDSFKDTGDPLANCFSSPRAVTAVRRVAQILKFSKDPEPILSSFVPNTGSDATESQTTTAYSASRETTVRPRTVSTTPTRDLPPPGRSSGQRKSTTPKTKRTRDDVYADEIKENIHPGSPGNVTSEGEKSPKAPVSGEGGTKRRALVRRVKK